MDMENPETWQKIPLLNYTPLHLLLEKSIVRFRGMIQDMFDPEIYLENCGVQNNGENESGLHVKSRERLNLLTEDQIQCSSQSNVYSERRSFTVVSIPALNEWAHQYEKKCNDMNMADLQRSINELDVLSMGVKRYESKSEDVSNGLMANDGTMNFSNKRICTNSNISEIKTVLPLNKHHLISSPIKERPSMACIVTIYKNIESYPLNSIIDVVGYLCVDRIELIGSTYSHLCNYSQIPQLQAITVDVIPHANPLLDERFLNFDNKIEDTFNMQSVHQELRKLLSMCLFNDDLAADYLLLNLISNVYKRSDEFCIGKFCLNICNFPRNLTSEYTAMLYQVVQMLTATSHYLPMTLDNMNTMDFIPKKDYESNKLVSGFLQLTPHTHLVLDETKLQEGNLNENGVLGIQCMRLLITQQQFKCNFHFYDINYDANIPVLVLSEGLSMLPNDFAVPLKTDSQSIQILPETFKAIHHFLQMKNRSNLFRQFITKAQTTFSDLSTVNLELIQNDFVEMRKNNILTSGDDLHRLLVLHRLLSIASAKLSFDVDLWDIAKNMETERRCRLQTMKTISRQSNI